MDSIKRYSSRKDRLGTEFLAKRLQGAVAYRRIAGYFRSSIFELVGEEIAGVESVRIICNSELDVVDIKVARAAKAARIKRAPDPDVAAKDAELLGLWNEVPPETEALLHRERYRKLYELLRSNRVEIRVVPKSNVFLHGKAGVIEYADGRKTCFMGSINETRSAFADNYEILWEDPSADAVAWVDEEFDALWEGGYPLPQAIIDEVGRIAQRQSVSFDELKTEELPAAVMVESPLYRAGEKLQPWQSEFVTLFLQHRKTYGKARLLLADEVGVGKTLSMATSAMMASLLGDGKVLILCPATLTLQWQAELKDKLGIPSAVWLSDKKCWQDDEGAIHQNKHPRKAEAVKDCPFAIAIVSQGLIVQKTTEYHHLLGLEFGTVVLDEGHKARVKKGLSRKEREDPQNNLLKFMEGIAARTKNLIVGTATPIQTDVEELWDLMKLLDIGAGFVMGSIYSSEWRNCEKSLPVVKGDQRVSSPQEMWSYLRTPLPPSAEKSHHIGALRRSLNLTSEAYSCSQPYSELPFLATVTLHDMVADKEFLKNNNPILRHTVLRRRDKLEDLGLLKRVGVDVHPNPKYPLGSYPGIILQGHGLMTNEPFNRAYKAAEEFTSLLAKRSSTAGFLKNLLLQRICSSFAAGKATAQTMLEKRQVVDAETHEELGGLAKALETLTLDEIACLQQIVIELSSPQAIDPKLAAVKYFLDDYKTGVDLDYKTWAQHGCIVFSQYYDTARWVASEVSKERPDQVVAVYAGAGKSGLFKGGQFSSVDRDFIKLAVKRHEIKLVVATDAACEGLNLQALGTLINVDLPWNPSKLEQRLGRIKRFGQVRDTVDMLNLVYAQTRDEKVYSVISERLKAKFDIFGSLPDTLNDDWIDDAQLMSKEIDKYIERRDAARNAFEIRYQSSDRKVEDSAKWELSTKVVSRQELVERLSVGWLSASPLGRCR